MVQLLHPPLCLNPCTSVVKTGSTQKKIFKYFVSITYNGCPQQSAVSLLREQMQVTVFLHIKNDSASSLERYHTTVHNNGFQLLELCTTMAADSCATLLCFFTFVLKKSDGLFPSEITT